MRQCLDDLPLFNEIIVPQIDTIYTKFITHIELLRNNDIVTETDDNYICPICLRRFSKEQMMELSLEDAPQASLGGRKIAITCKNCNNSSGHTVDIHLVNYLKRLDELDFIEGSDRRIEIINNGKTINADLEVGSNKDLKVIIPQKINNPQFLQEHIDNTREGNIIDIKNKTIDIDLKKVSTAILKNAYIILFSQFGYSFLLDKHYNRIREQIQNPLKYIVPDLWTRQHILLRDGIYLSNDNRYRGFFIIFSCQYQTIRKHRFCCFVPTPLMPYEAAYYYFKEYEPSTPIHMQTISGDYLTNVDNIKALTNWVYSWDMKLKL